MSFPANQMHYGLHHIPPLLRTNGPFFHPALSYGDVQFLQFPSAGQSIPQQQQHQQAFMGLLNGQNASTPVNASASLDDPSLPKGGQLALSPSATTASPATAADVASPVSSTAEEEQQQQQLQQLQQQQAPRLDLRRNLCDQNVFVFHLPPEWNEDMLRRLFNPFGNIMSVKVVQRPDGSSKGYGFVCFYESASAKKAVEDMNDFYVGGKRLKVSLKKTPEECMSLEVEKLLQLSESGGSFDPDHDCTLFVFHLPPHWTDNDIYERFKEFGELLSATVARKCDKSSRGYGFVKYANPRSAAVAITQLNGVDVGHNKRLKVQLKQQTQQHHKPGCTVFVFHLPSDWNETTFRQHFSHYGKIVNVTIQRDAQGKNRGFGFISFDKPQSAMNAIAGMNGFSVGQKRLKVAWKDGEERFFQPYASVPHLTDLVYGQQPSVEADAGGRSPTATVPQAAIPSPLAGFSGTTAGNAFFSASSVENASALAAAAHLSAYQAQLNAAAMNPTANTTAYCAAAPVPDYGSYAAIGTTPWNLQAMQLQKVLQEHQQREKPAAGAPSGGAAQKQRNGGFRGKR
eukprot:Selendium_serpulae@DN4651_c0_g1_i1.p1